MAYEFLKRLFGETKEGEQPKAMTYGELEAALDADKSVNIVNLADGGYVAKAKFDDKDTELKGVKEQLNQANAQIQSFKEMDIEGVKKTAAEWEQKYNEDTKKLTEQLDAQRRSHAEEMFLSGYKFTSKAAKAGILSLLREKKFTVGDDGTINGGKEFIESLMKDDDNKGAFVVDPAPAEAAPVPEVAPSRHPRFTAGSSGNQIQPTENPFNFGFTHIREPKKD